MEQFKNKYSFNKRKDESESVIKNIRIEYLLLFKNILQQNYQMWINVNI